jgi:hypothetical protein
MDSQKTEPKLATRHKPGNPRLLSPSKKKLKKTKKINNTEEPTAKLK